jgi:2-polyprenyl-3-methyl-5-hydroxy-6-metoxy-1,4-benzoquinol methylase
MRRLKSYIRRPRSIITGRGGLKHLYTFKNFPVFMGCVGTKPRNDLVADMDWGIDPETGVIQLMNLVPLRLVYQKQHVDGTGPTWARYYMDFARYIEKRRVKNVLEIGGGAGDLAKKITTLDQKVNWTIIEPNPAIKETSRISIIRGFFDKSFKYKKPVEVVVFSQVLEHAYNPQEFIRTIAEFLPLGGKLIFAYPNLRLWLKRKYTNALNFEHTIFLTDYYLDLLLRKFGFIVKDKYFYKDHSIFYSAVKIWSLPGKLPQMKNHYEQYKKLFTDFVKYYSDLVVKLNKRISKFDGKVYMFGAHIFSTYLFEFGLDKKKIAGLLDNSPEKIGKRLYGTNFIVKSPDVVSEKKKVAVVLKVGIYRDEIIEQLKRINHRVVIFE